MMISANFYEFTHSFDGIFGDHGFWLAHMFIVTYVLTTILKTLKPLVHSATG